LYKGASGFFVDTFAEDPEFRTYLGIDELKNKNKDTEESAEE
jgi:hypothetical protein